jgi:hypothetical protein
MSEYQYYEFLAVDNALDAAAMSGLRQISSRAHISQGRMAVAYNWGDFKGDPIALMEKHFDLFLYTANWGARRFALRLPKLLIDPTIFDRFAFDKEILTVHDAGENYILDMTYDSDGDGHFIDDAENGEDWMPQLSPLRSTLLAGDMGLFFLLWLIQVDRGRVHDEAPVPQLGFTSFSVSLYDLADFLRLDRHLLEAAALSSNTHVDQPSTNEVNTFLFALPEEEKLNWLKRLYSGDDPHLSASLRHRHRAMFARPAQKADSLTAGDLRQKARTLAQEKYNLEKQRKELERRENERKAAEAKAARLTAMAGRGEAAWQELDDCVALRNAQGYAKAAALAADLAEIAWQGGQIESFLKRFATFRDRHTAKRKFIEQLDKIALPKTAA